MKAITITVLSVWSALIVGLVYLHLATDAQVPNTLEITRKVNNEQNR